MRQQVDEAVHYIRKTYGNIPKVGVVLGSGLGSFTHQMRIFAEISYSDIPNFPLSTVEGHGGKLCFGQIDDKEVVAMAGRFHYYEGYTTPEVVFPIRVLKSLGISTLLISNAAGGTNKSFKIGDLMIIKDHISFFTANPLIGQNDSNIDK
jgi:purine-nucleoside phosphorylase